MAEVDGAPRENPLTRKIGPLPVWGWAGVAVLGILVVRYIQNRNSSATPSSANYTATVPSTYTEPTATLSTPSGFSYSGPLSGLQALLPTGALSSTNGSTSGPTNPPTVSSGLPPVNAANYPSIVKFGQYSPSDYTQIGSITGPGGQYTGQNVSGGAPVYASGYGGFTQGFNPATLPVGTGIYIPSSLSGYESGSTVSETL